MKCLALDFGGSYLKYALIDENANLTEKGEVPTPASGVDAFVDAIKGIYKKYEDQVEGIAISMPGNLDDNTGYARTAGALLDLYGQNVFDLLKDIPVPISVENDGKCGALAEVWKGSLKDSQDGVVIIIGTGLAGGLIKDRRIHKGKTLAAGEFSCLMVQPGDLTMQNMMVGPAAMMGLTMAVAMAKGVDPRTLETGALQENFAEKSEVDFGEELVAGEEKEEAPEAPQIKIDGPQIFKWLEEGDPAVTAIYQNFINHLAFMAYNLQVTFDPDKIAFGGGVTRQPRLIKDIQGVIDGMFGQLDGLGIPLPITKPEIVNCEFLSDANLVGAMYNFLIHHKPELAQ